LTKNLFELVDLAPVLEHTVMKTEPPERLLFLDDSRMNSLELSCFIAIVSGWILWSLVTFLPSVRDDFIERKGSSDDNTFGKDWERPIVGFHRE